MDLGDKRVNTKFRPCNCFLSSVATNGKDGHGLKLGNIMLCQLKSPKKLWLLLFRPCNCFLSSVATNGKDGHGLKLGKIMLCQQKSPKKLWFLLPDEISLTASIFITLRVHFAGG